MSFIIGCDSFLSLRNVRNGNLGRHLRGVRAWVDPHQLEGSRIACPEGVVVEPLIDFAPDQEAELARLLASAYAARKAYYDGRTFWHRHTRNCYRKHPRPGLRRAASLASAGVRFAGGWLDGARGKAQTGRQACAEALRRHPLSAEYRCRFEAAEPEVVTAFSLEGSREMLLMEAANAAGVPTAVMIRSRDNLAAKIQHLPDAARYMVWSEVTRRYFLRLYPEIDPARVIVTGSPQFDRHLDPAYRLDRKTFFEQIGLDPARPLIVYTLATPGLIPHESEIVQHLADAAHAGKFARRAQLLVRGHPRMFGSDLTLLPREHPEARSFPRPTAFAYRSPEHEAQVVRLILEDEPMHLATLAYQDVQVNVCGTMTIDSAILDRPTVNIYYDLVKGVPPGLSVRNFYERSDARQMMAYGASRLARDPEECLRLINRYLEDPSLDAEGRRRAREEDCGPLDGCAGERIAQALAGLARPGCALSHA